MKDADYIIAQIDIKNNAEPTNKVKFAIYYKNGTPIKNLDKTNCTTTIEKPISNMISVAMDILLLFKEGIKVFDFETNFYTDKCEKYSKN